MPVPHPDLVAALGHDVPFAIPSSADHPVRIAVSVFGDPPQARAAWVHDDGTVVARVAGPPGVPSAVRPAVATIIDVDADGASDRIILGLAAGGITAVRVHIAAPEPVTIAIAPGGIIAGHLPQGIHVIALDALGPHGESVGRLERTGMSELRSVAGRMEGHLGASHGMAAGFGAGDTVGGLAVAEGEAGYQARLPAWLPPGFALRTVRVEPEAAYPFAPPSIAIAWTADDESDARILLRQAPAPLAVPELPDARGREVDINGARGVMRGRGRGVAFLVWEDGERVFGIQARYPDDPEAVALAVARSIAPATPTAMT